MSFFPSVNFQISGSRLQLFLPAASGILWIIMKGKTSVDIINLGGS